MEPPPPLHRVTDFGRSFCTQSMLSFESNDIHESGVPGNVCRAQILASCEVTRDAGASAGGTASTYYLCQPCIGEHMYREALPDGAKFQFQQPTSQIWVVAQRRGAGLSGQEKTFADHRPS